MIIKSLDEMTVRQRIAMEILKAVISSTEPHGPPNGPVTKFTPTVENNVMVAVTYTDELIKKLKETE